MSKLKSVVFDGEIYALRELPKALSGSSVDVGTIRCGNWYVPPERSVGHAGAADDVVDGPDEELALIEEVSVATAVGAMLLEEAGRPRAVQPKPPVLNVTSSQPAVDGFASLKML